jgi:hypothetical protein
VRGGFGTEGQRDFRVRGPEFEAPAGSAPKETTTEENVAID